MEKQNELWMIFEQTSPPTKRWQRTVGWIDGVVFVPIAAVNSNEDGAFLLAAFDGISLIKRNGHLYAPAQWVYSQIGAPEGSLEKLQKKADEAARDEGLIS